MAKSLFLTLYLYLHVSCADYYSYCSIFMTNLLLLFDQRMVFFYSENCKKKKVDSFVSRSSWMVCLVSSYEKTKQKNINVMEAPYIYITQDVTGIIFLEYNYGPHTTKYQRHKSLVLQHKGAKNGRQETETRYNYNQSYCKNTWRVGGQGRIGNGGWQKKKNSETPHDPKPLHILKPILPAKCEKNIFCFIRSSASVNPRLLLAI